MKHNQPEIVPGNEMPTIHKLTRFSAPNVYETIFESIGSPPGSKILDVGAGHGALSNALKEKGFDVFACDLNGSKFWVDSIPFKAVDLNGPIPYSDSFFDFITCVEVIEHLENPWHLLRECHRLLRPTGELLITTPNVTEVFSRLLYLVKGRPRWFPFKGYVEHINPLTLLELELIAKSVGFKISKVTYNRGYLPIYKKGNWWYPTLPFKNGIVGEILILRLIKN